MAADRLYDAATDLIARDGLDAFDVDRLATEMQCSRATVYRSVGGKAEIRDAVLARGAANIIAAIRSAVDGLAGPERVVTAITLALNRIRTDPLGQVLINSVRHVDAISWLTSSEVLADFAADLSGLTEGDHKGAQWILRVVLSLVYWPGEDEATELAMVQRFVAPSFAESRCARE